MKLEFEVISKTSHRYQGTCVKLASVLDRDGLLPASKYTLTPLLATVDFESSDSNLLDDFCVGDIVSLELTVAEPVQRKIIKDVNSWS